MLDVGIQGPANYEKNKGAWVVATPDGVWHRDSHYRSPLIGGLHKLIILIREKLEDVLQFLIGFFLDLFLFLLVFVTRGPGWSPLPMGFGIGILITGGNV